MKPRLIVVVLGPRNAQLRQSAGDVTTVRRRADVFVDVEHPSVGPDIKRPPRGVAARRQHPVRTRHLLARVAQNRIIHAKRLCKARIRVDRVDARRKVSHLEAPQIVTARPERFAFGGSAAGKRLGKPRQNDCLTSSEVAEPISTSVRTRKRKIGRQIARLE